MASLCNVTLLLYIQIVLGNAIDCKWTIDNNILDLSSLYGKTMEHFDGSYSYSYTICKNGLQCNNQSSTINVMAKYYKTVDKNNSYSCTKYCATYNSSVIPSYDKYYGTWKLEYFTGQTCSYTIDKKPSVFRAYFNCNHKAKQPIVVSSAEVIPCEYEMIIETYLACNITTQKQAADCIFTDIKSGLSLNLSSVEETVLEYNNYNEMYEYKYMICGNGINCTNSDNNNSYDGSLVMSDQISMKDKKCNAVLGVWNDGIVEPIYDSTNKMWTFHYINGYGCENKPREFIANFVCDPFTHVLNVTNATEFKECKYKMDINTVLACG